MPRHLGEYIMKYTFTASLMALSLALTACTNDTTATQEKDTGKSLPTIANINSEHIANADKTPEVWLSYGGTYDEQRFSRLETITTDNVENLGVAWTYDLETSRGVEATPIVVDGVMYVTGSWSIVYALDAKTGEELWVYNPQVSGEDAAKGCCDVVNRGVAVHEGKVIVGVFDGRIEALDAKTGKVVWSTLTVDKSMPYTITGAPRVVKDKVLIGNGGAEFGVRGYVTAYDVNTGKLAWRFYTTPNPDKTPDGAASDEVFAQKANATWGDSGAWTTDGGGGTVWDSIIYDTVNDSVIFGVGNASPWNSDIRDPDGNGDNFFLSSIVAVDADTGEYKWHFQTTPRDQFDFTATQSLILADLPIGDGDKTRRVVMQAPKNGFYYVLDAKTGEFLSGKPYVELMTWASGLDENGRPIENPDARNWDKGFVNIPGPMGGHNWHPMAYSPQTGLAYIPAQQVPQLLKEIAGGAKGKERWNIGGDMAAGVPLTYPKGTLDFIRKDFKGSLLAWDPVKQEARWSVPHSGPGNGGVMATASNLVFQGNIGGELVAYNATTGDKLWAKQVNSGVVAPPSTYSIDGEQYIAIATGWGGGWALNYGVGWAKAVTPDVGHVVTFKLGGTGTVPEIPENSVEISPKGQAFGSQDLQAHGLRKYAETCMVCHGPLVVSSGVVPDLRWSYQTADKDGWNNIVMDGALTDTGMISFKEYLNDEDAEAIRAYVMGQAWLAVNNGSAKPPAK
jgi:PQQ-dependent dehydrogenase (methanol/ethanol family)